MRRPSYLYEVIFLGLCPFLSGSSGLVLSVQILWVTAAAAAAATTASAAATTSLTLSEVLQTSRGPYVTQLVRIAQLVLVENRL